METTEKIVEAYCRYIKGWATIPNIKCSGKYEIDLLAVDPRTLDHYHIETGVSISESFSKLTAKPFSPEDFKVPVKKTAQRRTVGYFAVRKFGAPQVVDKLKEYGFQKGRYSKVIVTWSWTDEAKNQAEMHGIILWDFRELLRDIGEVFSDLRTYFADDTLRTLQLFAKALDTDVSRKRSEGVPTVQDFRSELLARFEEADKQDLSSIKIEARRLHRQVGGYPGPNHRMPTCCDVMLAEKRTSDTILSQPRKGKGASLTIQYTLPRAQKKLPL